MQTCELEYIERAAQSPLTCRIVSIENSSPHWHYEYEAFFVLRGGVTATCEGDEWRLKAGDIFLFNACEIHSLNRPEPDNLCLVAQFSLDVFSDVYRSSFRFDLNTRAPAGVPGEAYDIFRRDLAWIGLLMQERPNGHQFFIRSRLYDFVGSMFKYLNYEVGAAARQPAGGHLKDFDAIKGYIKQRFAEEISIGQMCRDLAMSRAKLYRTLKEAGTESYKSLVNYYRVEFAKGLLRNTASSIQYIASVSGFESDSSFYRVFKELTSVSPGRYRERPHAKEAPVGIQGYVSYNMPQALDVLREYCAGCQ
ncbi:MAG: AraC family transcriptional regulator [Clostridiales Family XIII bacterium]|jgi:AraC-like DNA-binding protein|nr:AraC family transcriptional regulator [Clostridiales Family XIII bacterium]